MNEDSDDDSLSGLDEDFEEEHQAEWGDFFDFQRCERPNGTFYGIRDGWICRKGRPVGPRPKPPPRPRAPKKPRALKGRVSTKKPLAPLKPRSPRVRSVDRAGRVKTIKPVKFGLKTGRKSGKSEEQKKNERLAQLDVGGAFKPSSASRAAQRGGLGLDDGETSRGRKGKKKGKPRLSLPKKLVRRKLLLDSQLRKIRARKNRGRAVTPAKVDRLNQLKLETTKRKIDRVKDKKVTKPALKTKKEKYLQLKREVVARRSRRDPLLRNALEGVAESRSVNRASGERKSKVSAKVGTKTEKTAQATKIAKSSKPASAQKTGESRPNLATRRNEIKTQATKKFKSDIKKAEADPRMREYLDGMSADARKMYDKKAKDELRRRVKEAWKEQGLVPDDAQIREAQRNLSRKEFAPRDGKVRIVKVNGRYNSELEDEVNSGLNVLRKSSPDANEKISALMKALEKNPIAISEYSYFDDEGDEAFNLASKSGIRGKLTRAGADVKQVEGTIRSQFNRMADDEDWDEEDAWAAMRQNTIFFTGSRKSAKRAYAPEEASSLLRKAQRNQEGALWTWGKNPTGESPSRGEAEYTLIHEIGHIMHARAFSKQSEDDIERITSSAIIQRSVKPPTQYGQTNSFETVAELYTAYITNGPQLKEEMPESYQFIDEIVKKAYGED